MKDDFLIEMGYAGLTGRLKRLSDAFVYSTKEFYRAHGLDIEPNWHMIFLLLQKHKQLTVMEIAEALHLSHPAIVKLADKMKKQGYIQAVKDAADNRKYQLTLTKKALKEMPKLEMYWAAGIESVKEIMNHNTEILKLLKELEDNISEADFKARTDKNLRLLNNNKDML